MQYNTLPIHSSTAMDFASIMDLLLAVCYEILLFCIIITHVYDSPSGSGHVSSMSKHQTCVMPISMKLTMCTFQTQ